MVLVPQDVYDAMMKNKLQPKTEHISEPEERLHTLLADQKLPTDHKI